MLDRRNRLAEYFLTRYGDRGTEPGSRSALLRGTLFKEWVGTGHRVLDVGCGSGIVTRFYTDGNAVTGIDVDRDALTVCHERYGVEAVWGEFGLELPFEPGSFDVVVAGETIEHLPYPAIFLEEVRRVLRPGGRFIGYVPNAYRYRARLDVLCGRPFDRDPTHLHHFSLDALRALFSRHFIVEAVLPVRGKWSSRWPSLFAHYFAWCCRGADVERGQPSAG
jgi:SAM-dependent methyltransferase